METTGTVYNGARKEHLILFEKKLFSKSE